VYYDKIIVLQLVLGVFKQEIRRGSRGDKVNTQDDPEKSLLGLPNLVLVKG
jgi:hypothetical protein